jgi:DNA-directed RNA polymerase specialized sigma24 family protein
LFRATKARSAGDASLLHEPRAWLKTVAHNAARTARRARRLTRVEQTDLTAVPCRSHGPEAECEAAEVRAAEAAARSAITAMPGPAGEAARLYWLEGGKWREVTSGLGITDGALTRRLRAARRSLRSDFDGRYDLDELLGIRR